MHSKCNTSPLVSFSWLLAGKVTRDLSVRNVYRFMARSRTEAEIKKTPQERPMNAPVNFDARTHAWSLRWTNST
jgi:hypothetical protein